MMTMLAFKIRNQEMDKVIQIDAKKMYKDLIKQRKQFFEWPRCIEEEANKLYLNYKYKKMNRVHKMIGNKKVDVS
jgi:hypothetical protein